MNYANLDEIKMSGTELPVSFFIKNAETIRQSDCDRGSVRMYEAQMANRMEIDYLVRKMLRKQLANS